MLLWASTNHTYSLFVRRYEYYYCTPSNVGHAQHSQRNNSAMRHHSPFVAHGMVLVLQRRQFQSRCLISKSCASCIKPSQTLGPLEGKITTCPPVRPLASCPHTHHNSPTTNTCLHRIKCILASFQRLVFSPCILNNTQ